MKTSERVSIDDAAVLLSQPKAVVQSWIKAGLLDSANLENGSVAVSRASIARIKPQPLNYSSKPRVVSFFSGCGGLDIGFSKAGFALSYANDFFLDACLSYSRNVGAIDPRSIHDVQVSDVGDAEVLLAGFPCQPFSNAGSRKGTADPRGTLFWETLRFVDALKPKILVFENVRGLLSMKNPDGENLIDAIEREIETRGYHVNHKLLNAFDYGVPQNRFRVVIVGVRKDVSQDKFDFDSIVKIPGENISRALSNLPKNDPNDEHWQLSPQSIALAPHIPQGGSWKSVPVQILPPRLLKIRANMAKYHSPNFYRRFALDEVMGTVTAAATPENSGILHPTQDRRYTVREIARFQTFPDSYVFCGRSVSTKYKQIGNAVPPVLARALAKALLERFFSAK